MRLTDHFTLQELIASQTAARLGVDNTPGKEELEELGKTAKLLESVRSVCCGLPVLVSSGYRCEALNLYIGGATESQHIKGQAADFIIPPFTPMEIVNRVKESTLIYDQLILEYGQWVHISQSESPRRETLIIDSSGTRLFDSM